MTLTYKSDYARNTLSTPKKSFVDKNINEKRDEIPQKCIESFQ